MIGAGAATLLVLHGRVAGISGILDNAVRGAFGAQIWRVAFLMGLVAPALAFTMGDAVLVAVPEFYFVRKRHVDSLGEATTLPDRFNITARLIIGSAIFGCGWGFSGICPRPSPLLPTSGSVQSWVFVGGIVAGFFASSLAETS